MPRYEQKIDQFTTTGRSGRRFARVLIPLPRPEGSYVTALGYVRTMTKALQAMLESLEDEEKGR